MSFKEALKIHGHLEYDSCESDSGKSEFDEEYYNLKPPAVDIEKLKVVEIRPQVLKTQNYVDTDSCGVGDSKHFGAGYQNFTSLALETENKNVLKICPNIVSKAINYRDNNLQFSPTFNSAKHGIVKKNTLDGNVRMTANRPIIMNRSDYALLTNTLQNVSNKNLLSANFRTTASTSTITDNSQNVQSNVRTTANTSIITNRSDYAQLTNPLQNVSNKNPLAGNFRTTASMSTITDRNQNVRSNVRTTANISVITNRSENAQPINTLETQTRNVSNKNPLAGNFRITASTSTGTDRSQYVKPTNTSQSVTNATEVIIRAPSKQNSCLIIHHEDTSPLLAEVKNDQESICSKCCKWFRCC